MPLCCYDPDRTWYHRIISRLLPYPAEIDCSSHLETECIWNMSWLTTSDQILLPWSILSLIYLFIYFTVGRETAHGFKPTQTSFHKARRESLREKYEISNQDVKIENEKELTKSYDFSFSAWELCLVTQMWQDISQRWDPSPYGGPMRLQLYETTCRILTSVLVFRVVHFWLELQTQTHKRGDTCK